MLTSQEVFDKVIDRLMDGTGQAVEVSPVGLTSCTYLDTKGNKCAVGIFLPDNEDMQNFDGNVRHLISAFYNHVEFPIEIVAHRKLFYYLQNVHDSVTNWKDKEFIGFDKLEEVATIFNLEYERKIT